MKGKAHAYFGSGEAMKEPPQATYQRGIISNDAQRWGELDTIINKASVTCNRWKNYWYTTNRLYKWKLQVYNAIIVAQSTYGLSTVQLTPAIFNRSDASNMRGQTYILKIEYS